MKAPKFLSVFLIVLLACGFFLPLIHADFGSYRVTVDVTSRNVLFLGDSATLRTDSNSSTVQLSIYDAAMKLVYSASVAGNSMTVFKPPETYGLFTVQATAGGVTATSWFWLQDTRNLQPFTLPYRWSWKGIDYTLTANYELQASKDGKTFSVEWLSEIFTKLKPQVTLLRNDGLLYVGTYGKDVSADSWVMNTYFGVKIRVNGTLTSPTLLKWNYKAVTGTVLYNALDSFKVGGVVFDYSDFSSRSTGLSYSLDKTGLKLNVNLATQFDVDPLLFSDGFESNDFSAYSGTEVSSGCTLVTESANPDHGTYNAKSVVTQYNQADCYKSGLTAQAVMYHYTKYKFGTLPANNNEFYMISGLGSTNYTNSMFVLVRKSGTSMYWGLSNFISGVETRYYEASASNPTTDTYYAVKVMRDVTNGAITLWVDGAQKLTQTGLSLSGNNNIIWSGIGYSECAATQTVYFDCDVADSNDITSDPFASGTAYSFSLSESAAPIATLATQKAMHNILTELVTVTAALYTKKTITVRNSESTSVTATTAIQKTLTISTAATTAVTTILDAGKGILAVVTSISESSAVTAALGILKTIHVIGSGAISITDALEILKHLTVTAFDLPETIPIGTVLTTILPTIPLSTDDVVAIAVLALIMAIAAFGVVMARRRSDSE